MKSTMNSPPFSLVKKAHISWLFIHLYDDFASNLYHLLSFIHFLGHYLISACMYNDGSTYWGWISRQKSTDGHFNPVQCFSMKIVRIWKLFCFLIIKKKILEIKWYRRVASLFWTKIAQHKITTYQSTWRILFSHRRNNNLKAIVPSCNYL